ncbi:MAG: N-acetylmannosamine-6-phosphate 2-epimerase [Bacteroidetes bacterium]|nr:N-acetylmannosamine-6-phosphate 2-epimerase [Bacteroidota bacterium]MBU2586143.1 N-acetylmannosamine-6-phosphate 2-epimerase [Bacteroidota bacterium]
MKNIFKKLKSSLIVSCQAEGDDPFNSPESVAMFAKAVVMGGAKGIRSEGIDKTKKILESVNVPVIGLIKSKFEDGSVRITGSFDEVKKLIDIGCHIIAIDGTFRKRENFVGSEFIKKVKQDYSCIVMADIATHEEAVACADSGVDCISTTLNGYTQETKEVSKTQPNFELVEKLSKNLSIPVFAEGRIASPEHASKMIQLGAWAVVVGTAITRPRIVTSWYVDAIERSKI